MKSTMSHRLTHVASAVVLALLASCGLPASGDVHVVRRILTDQQSDDSDIRRIAPGPAPGATPEQIVRGFFAAESNDDDQHAVARQFLERPSGWDAGGGADVYDENPLRVSIAASSDPKVIRAVVGFARKGRIGDDGSFTAEVATVTETLDLRQVAGQWRLVGVPKGLQLSGRDVARSFVAANIWFLTRDSARPRLVPDPRLLQTNATGLPSSLARALLAGPSSRLLGVTRTAVPAGSQLQGSAVLVDGEISVDFSTAVATVRGEQRDFLLAQLAQTMRQVTGATRLRVTSGGRGLSGADPEAGSIASLTSILEPTGDEAPTSPPTAYGLSGGELVALGSAAADALPAGWTRISDLLRIVGDPDSQRIVALQRRDSLTDVLLGGVATRPVEVLTPAAYDAVAITPDGKALVHRAGAHPAVLLADDRGSTEVTLPNSIHASDIIAMCVARDGLHVALALREGQGRTARRVLQITTLVRAEKPTLSELGPPVPNLSQVSDVAWSGATHVIAIGASDSGAVRPFDVLIDGSELSPLSNAGLPSQPVSIADWPGSRMLVVDEGKVWAFGSGWAVLGRATDVTYA